MVDSRNSEPDPEIELELQQLKLGMGLTKADQSLIQASRLKRTKPTAGRLACPAWGKKLKLVLLVGGILSGSLWLANLPFPFIRKAVNRVAPIALAPSYVSWDYHYRQAIPLVEQAQQLINHPISPADLVLAETVLTKAKTHVEALPVTFLSDSPSSIYRYWYGSNYDQFQELRKSSGQMTARLFQERQSQALLTEAEQALATAKTQYINAQSHPEKLAALAAWASALNEFEQISANTLAGQTARTKLKLHENEYLSIRQ